MLHEENTCLEGRVSLMRAVLLTLDRVPVKLDMKVGEQGYMTRNQETTNIKAPGEPR